MKPDLSPSQPHPRDYHPAMAIAPTEDYLSFALVALSPCTITPSTISCVSQCHYGACHQWQSRIQCQALCCPTMTRMVWVVMIA